MIQRIQSVYLFLAALASAGVFAFPFASSAIPVAESKLFNDGVFAVKEFIGIAPLFGAATMLSFIAIFLYSNRTMQKVMIAVCLMLVIIASLLMGYTFSSDAWATAHISELKDQYGLGLPIFAVIFLLIARVNINKDDKLVQSMDRLR
jgi:FtsH-binding integral membrane protein